ncbi:retrotransposon protein, putative, ty1-copia subclass [Tanacetum coccineum]
MQNYNMHGMGKTVNKLHAMLKLYEETLPKKNANPELHAIRSGRVQKNQNKKPHKAGKGGKGKNKSKMGYAPNNAPFVPKPKIPPPPKKENPAKDADVAKLGTGEGNVLCISPSYGKRRSPLTELALQGLRGSKKLKPGALSLYVGNGNRAAVEAIGTYHLELPSGLVIVLNNYHYAPSITRVSKNNLVYFNAFPRDGIFEIDMSCSNTNDHFIYSVSNKRAKVNLDSSLLWHYHLRHISKKHIEKLQHDGLIKSIDIHSLEKYVSCLSGKMTRKPYSHQVERAKELLGLIHTDEVENQLGKTIKSLRSDRGGKYMSLEFLNHLKEHGIIAHRTPPYTPQNNGVSESRNRILLDMVQSMMSQTTLPKSLWDYARKTAARILNMVPTKKVDKTPYEIWHGQAPKMSYLKVWGCEAYVKRDILTKPDKLDPRSFKNIFIGYPKETIGYTFYSPSENKVFIARNAEFFESNLIDLKASGSVEELELIQGENTNPSVDTSLDHEEDEQEIIEPQSDLNPIRKSSRTSRAPDHMCLYMDYEEHELGDLGEPANYKAALLDPESKKWLDAMNMEMQSMKQNDV